MMDSCTLVAIFVPASVPPKAMLTLRVMGGQSGTLTDTCGRLIEPLPPPPLSNVTHCPYVGEDIEVCCTSSIEGSTIIHEHNGQLAGTDGKFRFMDTEIPDYVAINGPYFCTAYIRPGCADQVVEYARLFGKEERIKLSLQMLL